MNVASASAPAETAVDVSVVMATYLGHERIRACLESLVAQTLPGDRFEVIVVQNGPPCPTEDVVRAVAAAHPGHVFRYIESSGTGAGRARNVGIGAARGRYLTFVDDDDRVGPRFLSSLLAAVRPGIVPMAPIGDVVDGGDGTASYEGYYGEAHRSDDLHDRLVGAISVGAGKLVPTALARGGLFQEHLSSGEDVVFWYGLYTASGFTVLPLNDLDGSYLRTVRGDSVGRRDLSWEFNVLERLDCVAALAPLRRAHPDDHVGRRLIRAQCRWIHRYLVEHPDEHRRVEDEVEKRGLHDLPWDVVNHDTARDLAISYCFPPFLDTSGMVAARRLRLRGVPTDVISHSLAGIRGQDPTSLWVSAPVVDRRRMLRGPASFANWDTIRTFTEETLETVREWEQHKGPYRSVYSRAMAAASHFAAAMVKLRSPEIRWIAEISDPMLLDTIGQKRPPEIGDDWLTAELAAGLTAAGFPPPPDMHRMYEWVEYVVYALADEVIFTNELQRDLMMGYCRDQALAGRAKERSIISAHPTLPPYYYGIQDPRTDLDPDVLNIAYFGVFYANRGLDEVTTALNSLENPDRRRVRLHVFVDSVNSLRLEVLQAGLADVISVHPFVPYLEFLALTTRFDVVLVNDTRASEHLGLNPYLPSKVSDYLGSGTPIWAVYEPGSVLSTMACRYRTAIGDAHGAHQELLTMLREFSLEEKS